MLLLLLDELCVLSTTRGCLSICQIIRKLYLSANKNGQQKGCWRQLCDSDSKISQTFVFMSCLLNTFEHHHTAEMSKFYHFQMEPPQCKPISLLSHVWHTERENLIQLQKQVFKLVFCARLISQMQWYPGTDSFFVKVYKGRIVTVHCCISPIVPKL